MVTFVLCVLLLACLAQATVAEMLLEPSSLTVLRGEEARLTCSTSAQWTVMVWLLNDSSVLTVSRDYGVLPSNNPNVTAEDGSTPQRSSWTLVLRNAARHHQGHVTCDLQNIQKETASLFVQVKGSVEVSGGNRTVLSGQWILFECHVSGWYPAPRLGWLVNGKEHHCNVLILVNGVEVGQGDNTTSEVSVEGLFTATSNLSVYAAESSHVECLASVPALSKPLASGVRLTVVAEVVVPEGDDCTPLLASTVTLSTTLLLLLLLLGIVLCYRRGRREKSSQQGAIWFNQSLSGRTSIAEAAGGKVNLGYCIEGLTDGHDVTETHTPAVTERKIPVAVSCSNRPLNSQSHSPVDLRGRSCKSTKRVTTV